jgi:uncharacterized membrane protein YecN with MAPEG domain
MEVTPVVHAAALWTGLNLAILLVLSVRVTRLRRRHEVVFGDGGVPELAQAVRAFGNAAEYVPAALVGLAMLALVQAAPLLVHIAGFLLFAGRIAHGVGLSRSPGPSLPRMIGVLATWLAYLFEAATLIFYAIP